MPEHTVAQAVRAAAAALGAEWARIDAETLMAHALGVSRSDMLLRHMGDAAPAAFAPLLERRLAHEPVPYILGEQEFYGRSFAVSPAVLIPRGDSETVIAAALEVCAAPKRVLDCGTGSGALLLTVLAERPDCHGIGIDSSRAALDMAAQNAARLGLTQRTGLTLADWTQQGWTAGLGETDLILANPPYVETGAPLDASVREYEPASALFAGADGLDDYRILIPQLRDLLAPGGVAVLEIGATQADAVSQLGRAAGFDIALRRDLAHRPRALVLR